MHKGFRAPKEPQEQLALRVLVVLEDFRVPRVPQVAPELKEQVDHKVSKAPVVQQAQLGHRVLSVLKGFREHKEQ